MCMRLARGGVISEWMRGLGLGFTNQVENMLLYIVEYGGTSFRRIYMSFCQLTV